MVLLEKQATTQKKVNIFKQLHRFTCFEKPKGNNTSISKGYPCALTPQGDYCYTTSKIQNKPRY